MGVSSKQAMYHWKQLWETWDLRLVILFSLILQIFLIFSAPLRKRMASSYIIIPMWLAYLLADTTANFAVGLISKSQDSTSGPFANPDLVAFWAPFLFVHLGGPDTITAFALEDNELWLRHLLQLVFQCVLASYVFILTLPANKLWLPTLLMFAVGFIKYVERTRSLYLASSSRFRDSLLTEPNPGPNYAKLVDHFFAMKEANLPTRTEIVPIPRRVPNEEVKDLEDLDVVRYACRFFQTFKGLIADLILSYPERDESRTFFQNRTARDAFKVIEVELNFFYEILYTKARVLQGTFGYFFRFVSVILNIAALMLFYFTDKLGFRKFDVGITYTLLLGAIALDLIAVFMVLFSDWTAVFLTKPDNPSLIVRILKKSLNVDRKRWTKGSTQHSTCSFGRFMQIVHRRWSESLSQLNLIHYCLHPRSKIWEKIIKFFGLTNRLDGLKYVETIEFNNELRNLIFKELKMKSEMADDLETATDLYSARGDWVLQLEGCTELLPWVNEVDFDESLLLWHVATDLCFHSTDISKINVSRDLSKFLSNYMLYLLIMKSPMMSTVAGIGLIRFRDTCAEAKKVFSERRIRKVEPKKKCFCCSKSEEGPDEAHKHVCRIILAVNTEFKPVTVKGDSSKSVLFDACMLAKELINLGEERKWKVMSKVWVEFLCYAACRSRAGTHAAQLGKGGELITLVWLLMAHLGIGNQFQISDFHRRTTLTVGK